MRLPFGQVMGVDVDDVTPDSLGRVERQRQVLVLRVQRQVFAVDHSLVDGVGARVVHDFTAKQKTTLFVDLALRRGGLCIV